MLIEFVKYYKVKTNNIILFHWFSVFTIRYKPRSTTNEDRVGQREPILSQQLRIYASVCLIYPVRIPQSFRNKISNT